VGLGVGVGVGVGVGLGFGFDVGLGSGVGVAVVGLDDALALGGEAAATPGTTRPGRPAPSRTETTTRP
jgi:hypothetical protein